MYEFRSKTGFWSIFDSWVPQILNFRFFESIWVCFWRSDFLPFLLGDESPNSSSTKMCKWSLYEVEISELQVGSYKPWYICFQMPHYFLKSVHSFILNFCFVVMAKMDRSLLNQLGKSDIFYRILQSSSNENWRLWILSTFCGELCRGKSRIWPN